MCFRAVMCPAKMTSSGTTTRGPGSLMSSLNCTKLWSGNPMLLMCGINKPLNYLSHCSTRVFPLLRVEFSPNRAKFPDTSALLTYWTRSFFVHGAVVLYFVGCLFSNLRSLQTLPCVLWGRGSKIALVLVNILQMRGGVSCYFHVSSLCSPVLQNKTSERIS